KERSILDKVNMIIVSDHGMAAIAPERVVFLDDYVSLEDVQVVDWSPILALNPKKGKADEVFTKLENAHPQLSVFHKGQIPERYHYGQNPRIPLIIGMADEGWSLGTHRTFETRPHFFTGGNHGFDDQLTSMGATFIARGPAFKSGLQVAPFRNIHVYNLMAEILGLQPAPNQGSLDSVKVMLR
ncbi:MAG TPA: alkaline phosphatase family protein, partial [Mycobacterium sp.]